MFSRWRQRRADAKFDADRRKRAVDDVRAQGDLFAATFALNPGATAAYDAALLDPANIAIAQAAYATSVAEGHNHATAVASAESAYKAATASPLQAFVDAATQSVLGANEDNGPAASLSIPSPAVASLPGDERPGFFDRSRQRGASGANATDPTALDRSIRSLLPLVEDFGELGLDFEFDEWDEAAQGVIDRIFAFDVILRRADESGWRRFAAFAVDAALPNIDRPNSALRRLGRSGSDLDKALVVGARTWAAGAMAELLQPLPDGWFSPTLRDGRPTIAAGVKVNCVTLLEYAAVALAAFDWGPDADVGSLYAAAEPIAPISDVIAISQ